VSERSKFGRGLLSREKKIGEPSQSGVGVRDEFKALIQNDLLGLQHVSRRPDIMEYHLT